MAIKLDYHLKFNGRNPRHVEAALALASVEKRYKSSFIALAIEHYMLTHPFGISTRDLLDVYRQSDRTYQPKTPIIKNLQSVRPLSENPAQARDARDKDETNNAIDKAMDFYDIL